MNQADFFKMGYESGENMASASNRLSEFNKSLLNQINEREEAMKYKKEKDKNDLALHYAHLGETKRHNLAGETLDREKFNYEYGGGNFKNSLQEAKNAGIINDVAGYFNPQGEADRKFNAELSEFNYDGKDVNGTNIKKNLLTNPATQALFEDLESSMNNFNQMEASPTFSLGNLEKIKNNAFNREYNNLKQIKGVDKGQLNYQHLMDPKNAGLVLTDDRLERVSDNLYKKMEARANQQLREQTGDKYATISEESKKQLKNQSDQEANELFNSLANGGLGRIQNKFQRDFNELGQNSNTFNTENFFSGKYKEIGGSLAGGTYTNNLRNQITNDINQKNKEINNDPIKMMAMQNLNRNLVFRQQAPQIQNAIVTGQPSIINQGINNIVSGAQPNEKEIQQNTNNYLIRESIPIEKEAEITNKSPREINNERQEQKSYAIISSASPFVNEAFNSNLKQAEDVVKNNTENKSLYDTDIAKQSIDQKQQARETVANTYASKLTPEERDELLGKTSGLDKAVQNFFYSAIIEPLKSADRLFGAGKNSNLIKSITAEIDNDAKQYQSEHPVLSFATNIMGDVASLAAGGVGASKLGLKIPLLSVEAGESGAIKLAKNAYNLGIKGALYNGALAVAKSANDINEEKIGNEYFQELGGNLIKSFRDGAIIENAFGVAGYGIKKAFNKSSLESIGELQGKVQESLANKIEPIRKADIAEKSENLYNEAYSNLRNPEKQEELATEINKKIEKGQKGYSRFQKEHSEKLSQPLPEKIKNDLKNQFVKDYEKLGLSQREEHNAKNVEKFLDFINKADTGKDLIELSNLATSLPKSSENTGLYERFKNFTGKTLNDITGEDFNKVRNEYKQSKELQQRLTAEKSGSIEAKDLEKMRKAFGDAKISEELASNLLKDSNIRPALADVISNNIASELKKIPDNFVDAKSFDSFISSINDLNNKYYPFFKRNLPEFRKIQDGLNAYKNNAIALKNSFSDTVKMAGGTKEAKIAVKEIGKNITIDNIQELSKNLTEALKKQSNNFFKEKEVFKNSTPSQNPFKNDFLQKYFEKNPKEKERIFNEIYNDIKGGVKEEPLMNKNELLALLVAKGMSSSLYIINKFNDIFQNQQLRKIIDKEFANLILNPVGAANKSNVFMGNILEVRKSLNNLYSIRDNTALQMSVVKEYKRNG